MKIYSFLEDPDLQKNLTLAESISPYIDGIIISSLLLYRYGIQIIKLFKENNSLPLLLDTKIIERGRSVVSLIVEFQKPQWISIMAGATKQSIHATCSAARESGIKVMMNLLDARSLGQASMEAKNLGIDALLFHHSQDEPDNPLVFLDKWDMVRENTTLPVFISTNITRQNIHEIKAFQPDGLIIGQTIANARKPELEAQFFNEICKQ